MAYSRFLSWNCMSSFVMFELILLMAYAPTRLMMVSSIFVYSETNRATAA